MTDDEAPPDASAFERYCQEHSNWGRWGPDDQLGTLNFNGPDKIVAASRLIRRGKVFSLAIPLDADGPQTGRKGRTNPIHLMTATGTDHALGVQNTSSSRIGSADGTIVLPLQAGTQWDGLSHMFLDGQMWNGYSAELVKSSGAEKNDVCNMRSHVVGRGVLLDVARARGVASLAPGDAIEPADLGEAAQRSNVEIGSGDFLLIRTGDLGRRVRDQNWGDYAGGDAPGLSIHCIPWLADLEVAGVATDTWGVEVRPNDAPAGLHQPFHLLALIHMGMLLGEIFYLEELSEDCAADGVYEFFFVAPPLPITGAVASPVNPQAIK